MIDYNLKVQNISSNKLARSLINQEQKGQNMRDRKNMHKNVYLFELDSVRKTDEEILLGSRRCITKS